MYLSFRVCAVKPDASMALLYRFTRAKDRAGTGIFTRSVTRDFYRDATTKEFTFGSHRWVISFNRSDSKMLGVHLILRNATAGTRCYVDFTFCLLNREHFSKNEIYVEKVFQDAVKTGLTTRLPRKSHKYVALTTIENASNIQ
ncbi:uncharacterized protein TNCV_1775231 [Trichonephila clavipes]|nr:uncharacterized protein TNCV_1775231 [Trichonephila clavipes]